MTSPRPAERKRVLIACEFSGVVREAFRSLGHDTWSCDLLPAEDGSPFHIQGDVLQILETSQQSSRKCYNLLIAFPPCTHLAVSGARWFKNKQAEQQAAIAFARMFIMNCAVERVAVENPIGVLSSKIRKPDQIIQPWQFGHGETKAKSKEGERYLNPRQRIMGTVAWAGFCETVILIEPTDEGDDRVVQVLPRNAEELTFNYCFDGGVLKETSPDGLVYEMLDKHLLPCLKPDQTYTRMEMLELIGSLGIKCSLASFKRWLKDKVDSGRIEKLPQRGNYRIKPVQ